MTLFDIIVLSIMGVSAVVGFARGAVREMINVVSLVLAALAAVFALRYSGPVMRELMDPDWGANVAAIILVFIVAYIGLRALGSALTRSLQAANIGVLDRSIGVGFGLLRALVALGAFSLVFHAATPPERVPPWIGGAALYPLTFQAGEVLKAFAPKGLDMAGRLRPAIEDAVREGSAGPGYDARARQGLDDVVEKTR